MLDDIKKIIKENPDINCYSVAKELGYDTRNLSVAKNYWRAKYELLLEETSSHSLEEYVAPEEDPKEENKEEEITMPETWRDKGNKLYVKGRLSNTWRVYYTDQDYEEIDEKEVEERYARNGENWYSVNWYDFKYQDFYYRYDNGKYTRKRVGYLIYEPIDRNKYLSAKAMSSL